MKRFYFSILFCIVCVSACIQKPKESNSIINNNESDSTTYYFIRHAEKDLSNPENPNPHLTAEGYERAEKWAKLFEDVDFDAVYTTNFHRTRETASPTAKQNKLELILYTPTKFDLGAFLESTKGQNILIVGHSNSTPNLVNSIIKEDKYKEINESNYANVYKVIIVDNIATSTLSKMP